MFMLLALALGLEMALYQVPLWKYRIWVGGAALALGSYAHGLILVEYLGLAAWLMLFFHLFRIINILRVAKGRMHEKYLRKTTRRTSWILLVLSLLSLAVLWFEFSYPAWFGSGRVIIALAAGQVLTAAVLMGNTYRRLSKMNPRTIHEDSPLSRLPTVTVAIPARNETASLSRLLDSVVANDYPKLEVLVYDDCSQDATSEVIKGYAQAGVRFLHGKEPKANWVAKNQAYEELLKSASGEWVLFCGADTCLGLKTISSLVNHVLTTDKQMVSVLPRHHAVQPTDGLIQPLRYWWQVAMPRRIFNRPAALGTCWLVKRQTLQQLGGFGAVSQSVVPETYFARQIANKRDGYSFLRSSGNLEVISSKPFHDQLDRALRTRYPEVHRRLELVMLIAAAEMLLLIAPFGLVLYSLFSAWVELAALSALAVVLLTATNMMILAISSNQRLLPALVNFPLISIVEIVLGTSSMLAYEFGSIDWKGRNICLPVMHTKPKKFYGTSKFKPAA